MDAYLTWRWPTWRAQTAKNAGEVFISRIRRFWVWMETHRHIEGWDSFHRPDLEAWLLARYQDGVTNTTIHGEMGQVRSLLQFMELREWPFDPDLLRVKPPPKDKPLGLIHFCGGSSVGDSQCEWAASKSTGEQ